MENVSQLQLLDTRRTRKNNNNNNLCSNRGIDVPAEYLTQAASAKYSQGDACLSASPFLPFTVPSSPYLNYFQTSQSTYKHTHSWQKKKKKRCCVYSPSWDFLKDHVSIFSSFGPLITAYVHLSFVFAIFCMLYSLKFLDAFFPPFKAAIYFH